MNGHPSAETIGIYERAAIAQHFPAYKLAELRDTPARDLLWAIKLLDTARKLA